MASAIESRAMPYGTILILSSNEKMCCSSIFDRTCAFSNEATNLIEKKTTTKINSEGVEGKDYKITGKNKSVEEKD